MTHAWCYVWLLWFCFRFTYHYGTYLSILSSYIQTCYIQYLYKCVCICSAQVAVFPNLQLTRLTGASMQPDEFSNAFIVVFVLLVVDFGMTLNRFYFALANTMHNKLCIIGSALISIWCNYSIHPLPTCLHFHATCNVLLIA